MSATPSNPLPRPGVDELCQVGSCVPRAVVKGEPISNPCPGIVLQFVPSISPILVQVEALIPVACTPAPGKFKYVDAILPFRANLSNAGVSYHPLAVLT